jgi:hypothetical protein
MKNKQSKPRGKVPSLIGSTNGRPRPATVKRECNCGRCHCILPMGTKCVEIPKLGGFTSYPRYCGSCYVQVLEQTAKDLAELQKLIENGE